MYHSFIIHSSADGHLGGFPRPGYYKQCCNEHWGYTCLFQFWFPRCVCPALGLLGHKAVLFVVFKFNTTLLQVCAPTSYAEEAEVEQFYEDVQDLVELTPPKDVLFIIGDWNAKVGSQETPGVTGKFGLGAQN